MPTTVRCPLCDSRVKVPDEAEHGAKVSCPACDERFVPDHLRERPPRPTQPKADADSYGALPEDESPPPRSSNEDAPNRPRKKRRREREPQARSSFLDADAPMSDLAGWVGLGVIAVFILIFFVISQLGFDMPKPCMCGMGVVVFPLFLLSRYGSVFERR